MTIGDVRNVAERSKSFEEEDGLFYVQGISCGNE
jgi:hypothetical protein